MGHNYGVYFGQLGGTGFWIPTDGTSASTPVVAGIFALMKSKLGKRLGHVAPMLYNISDSGAKNVFHDIISGSNVCKSTCCGKTTGFYASNGYDAVTGLGTVDVQELLKVMTSKIFK